MQNREHAEVWALGDCASIPGPDGKPYPALAQHAMREAKVLAANIQRVLDGKSPKPFIHDNTRNDGLPWSQHGICAISENSNAWFPRVVRSPYLLPVTDARLESATPHDN